jgi:hypothetical protein
VEQRFRDVGNDTMAGENSLGGQINPPPPPQDLFLQHQQSTPGTTQVSRALRAGRGASEQASITWTPFQMPQPLQTPLVTPQSTSGDTLPSTFVPFPPVAPSMATSTALTAGVGPTSNTSSAAAASASATTRAVAARGGVRNGHPETNGPLTRGGGKRLKSTHPTLSQV